MSDNKHQFGKRFFALCASAVMSVVAVLSAATTANAVTLDEIRNRRVINIGIVTDQPPFSYIDGSGVNKGYDIDLTSMIAREMGVKVNYVQVTSANRISQLQTRRIDLLAMPFGIFPERAKVVRYVAPLAKNYEIIYGPVNVDLPSIEALIGRTVGVERGSSMDTAVTDKAPAGTKILRYDDASSAVQALLSGQVEFLGTFSHQFLGVESAAPGRFDAKVQLGASYLGYVVARDSEELAQWIGGVLQQRLKDGTLDKLYKAHFNADFPYPEIPKEINGVTFAISAQ